MGSLKPGHGLLLCRDQPQPEPGEGKQAKPTESPMDGKETKSQRSKESLILEKLEEVASTPPREKANTPPPTRETVIATRSINTIVIDDEDVIITTPKEERTSIFHKRKLSESPFDICAEPKKMKAQPKKRRKRRILKRKKSEISALVRQYLRLPGETNKDLKRYVTDSNHQNCLFIQDFADNTTNYDLYEKFLTFGPIEKCWIWTKPQHMKHQRNRANILFKNVEHAELATAILNETEWEGSTLQISICRQPTILAHGKLKWNADKNQRREDFRVRREKFIQAKYGYDSFAYQYQNRNAQCTNLIWDRMAVE